MIRRRVSRTLVAALAAGAVGSCKDVAGPIIITAPSAVTVTLVTPTSARITWVAPPEASIVVSYNVMRDGTKIGETSSTSYVDNGLMEGVTYRYQVSANGVSGELSDLSAESPAATITAPDVTPPAVLATSPGAGASAVARVATITVTFSENLDPTTINTTTFTVKGAGGVTVPGTVTYTAATRVAEFKADGVLPNSAAIAVTVTTGVRDPGGNRLSSDFSFSFSTRDEVPPVVTSTSPANSGVDVPVSAAIAVTFDETLDPATVTASSLVLTKTSSGAAVAAAVGFDPASRTATLTPSAALESMTGYTVTVATLVKDVAGNAMASPYSFSFTTGDAFAPSVVSVSPENAATGVSVGVIVNIVFSEPMDVATINATSVSLRPTGTSTPVTATVTYSAGNTATLTPSAPLSYSTSYTVVVTTGAKDAAGNALTSDFSSEFSTAAQPDATPPAILSTVPANGAVNVPVGAAIAAAFTEAMDQTSINAGTFTLRVASSGALVSGVVSYNASGNIAIFTPATALAFGTAYTATITTAAKDLAGNSLASASWSFSTAAAPDVLAPTVVATAPADGDGGISVNAVVTVTFSEAMDANTINSSTVRLTNNTTSTAVTGVVSYNSANNTATFIPNAPLAFANGYSITVTTGAKDAAGNSVATAFSAIFATAAAPDTSPPIVLVVTPTNGAANVAVGTTVTVTFSEAMDANTINSTTVRLTNSTTSTAVTGVVSYNSANNTATFTPNAPLAFANAYSITVTTGAKDAAGNSVATAFSAIFATMTAPDTSPPTVLVVTPTNGAANVAVGTTVTVTFSEPMNAATINSTTVNVKAASSGALVGGSIAYDAGTNTATFTPSSPLAFSTGYTVTVTTGAKDLAGNSLSGTVTSGFTTGVAPDTTPPTVAGTIPASGATNVAVTTNVRVTFSETMSAGTINGTTIGLRNTATSAEVGGAVSFNSGTNTATFTPNSALANSTSYTIVVSTGVKDQAGNSLANTFTSSFNTVAAPDITAPTVISTSPVNGSQEVPPDGLVSVTFSEAMNATTINTSTFLMVHASNGSAVPGTVAYNPATRVATFRPSTTIFYEDYTATVTTGVKDVAGNPLAQNVSFTFKFFASVPNLTGYWSGTTQDGSLHVHVTVDHSTGGATFSLRPNGCAGRQDECRVYPLTAEGQGYLNSNFPADVTSANGTFNDPQTSMTFTANGIVFTFTATVAEFYQMMTGTISGGTLPPQSLVMNRVGP